jgi:hypothetical protein
MCGLAIPISSSQTQILVCSLDLWLTLPRRERTDVGDGKKQSGWPDGEMQTYDQICALLFSGWVDTPRVHVLDWLVLESKQRSIRDLIRFAFCHIEQTLKWKERKREMHQDVSAERKKKEKWDIMESGGWVLTYWYVRY